jgi:ABC-2 type transport system permease protein
MAGSVFFEMLRRKWKHILYWGGGLALYAILTFALNPDAESLEKMVGALESMGSTMLSIMGITDVKSFSTLEGFIGLKYFSFLLVITGVYGVGAGLEVTANDEDKGIMDIVLSLPLPRWRIIVEKMLAFSLIVVGISLMTFCGLMIGREVASSPVDIAPVSLLEGALNFIPGTIVIMAVTVIIGTIVRRKTVALALSSIFVAVSYVLNTVADVARTDASDAFAQLSVFRHYAGATILSDGLSYDTITMLLLVAVGFVAGAVIFFRRRDVAV